MAGQLIYPHLTDAELLRELFRGIAEFLLHRFDDGAG